MAKLKLWAFLCLVLLVASCAAMAGEMYQIKCQNKQCHYEAQVNIGGGFTFDQITGYCLKENKFVYLRWKAKIQGPPGTPETKGEPAPEPIKVWNPVTGEELSLYKCPQCGEPFLPIGSIQELKHCPQCKEATLEYKAVGAYD